MVLYKKRLRYPIVGYYGLVVSLVCFTEVILHFDRYIFAFPFHMAISIFLVVIVLLLFVNNICGFQFLLVTNEK